ncbi:unnamed protein product [Fraxinus pennsylvanica]|uniref:Secreted protein n=1 Tax=Fraxinus pennsylvanica TaxID=56036 RepID=A0AAD2E193_9LAMI|nr:unnamed protein product [Fraxinus pennsylvanica]
MEGTTWSLLWWLVGVGGDAVAILVDQVCSGVGENAIGSCAELIFGPINASFSDDASLLQFCFRILPLDSKADTSSSNRRLNLASTLEVGPAGKGASSDYSRHLGSAKSVMTLAFQF